MAVIALKNCYNSPNLCGSWGRYGSYSNYSIYLKTLKKYRQAHAFFQSCEPQRDHGSGGVKYFKSFGINCYNCYNCHISPLQLKDSSLYSK